MKKLLAAFAVLALGSFVVAQEAAAPAAPAAPEKGPDAEAAWQAALKAIDHDGDGKCTPAECNDFVEKTEVALIELHQQNTLARIMRLDQNQDGAIAKDELPEGNDQIGAIFKRVDANQDGQIDQAEMKAMFAAAGNRPRQGAERGPRGQAGEERRNGQPGAGMARFDKNKDGVVTRDEIPADKPVVAAMFDRLDANKDGKLDQDEMKAGRPAGNRGEGRRNKPAPAGIKAE